MNIRYATDKDLLGISDMYDEYKGEDFVNLSMKFDRAVTQEHITAMIAQGKVIIAETGGKIIGMIAGIMSPSITSKDKFFVGCLFYIQKGLRTFTKQFLKETEALLKTTTDADQFILACPAFEEFEKSERFYSMSGFKRLETHWIKKL